MLPIRLELRNFLAYRQPDPLVLDGIHLACLTGPNGAGKSSLLDAITWALWGKARARSDDDLIHQGQTDMLVQLDFLQGETRYRVVRKRQKGKTARAGRSTLDLFVWDEAKNQYQPLTAPAIRQTEDKIVELLRLDYETFINSAFLQQGRADAFTVKTPAQRKEILAEILGLARWKEYEDRAKLILRQIEHELGVIAAGLEMIAQEEAKEPILRRDLEAAKAALTDAAAQREEAEARYQEVAGAEDQMIAAQARLAQAQRRIRDRQNDLGDIEAELARLDEQIARLHTVLAERDSIEAGYAQLQAARQADQQLGEKLQAMDAIKDRLNDVARRIESARADLDAQAGIHRDRIASAEHIAADRDELAAEMADVQAEVVRLDAEQVRRDGLREAINTLNEEQAALRTLNKTLYAEMKTIEARINQLRQAEATCPLCGQPLDDAQKTRLLDDLQTDGTGRGDQYRANQDRLAEIADTVRAHNEEIDAIDLELRRLDALRQRAAVLVDKLDAARSAADTVQVEQAELHAVESMLDSGEYAQELQAQRATIQAEIDALGYDGQAHSAARETLATYHKFESRQRDLDAALTQLPELQTALDNAHARRERWLKVLADEQAEAAAAQVEIEALGAQVEEARRREADLRERRTRERHAQERHTAARQAILALENARVRKAELEARRAEFAVRQGIYEQLRDAFGKNGVPAMIIEAAIPELEDAANHLLGRMTDGRMHVRLDTQREKRTGGVAETLDILISDELGTRSYENYSGGEAFRINFAIRVALSQMLARRAGAQLRTLFMDEGFGTQDETGRQRLVEALTAVQDTFDLLLVITHVEDLRDAFPVQIAVSKTPDGSRITVR